MSFLNDVLRPCRAATKLIGRDPKRRVIVGGLVLAALAGSLSVPAFADTNSADRATSASSDTVATDAWTGPTLDGGTRRTAETWTSSTLRCLHASADRFSGNDLEFIRCASERASGHRWSGTWARPSLPTVTPRTTPWIFPRSTTTTTTTPPATTAPTTPTATTPVTTTTTTAPSTTTTAPTTPTATTPVTTTTTTAPSTTTTTTPPRTTTPPTTTTTTTPPTTTTTTTTPKRTTTTTTTTIPPTTTTTAPSSPTTSRLVSGSMAPPSGYTTQQRTFDDQFSGTSLDTSKWVTYLGANGGVWNDFGKFTNGETGPNTPSTTQAEFFSPSQVKVDNGLSLVAQRSSEHSALGLSWVSGVVTTEGKLSLPTTGWYVQVKAKMPDTSRGMWPAIWFMPDTSSSRALEFDGHEGGMTGTPWPLNQNGATGYFAPSGHQETYWNAGTDLSAGYHVYGFKYDPSTATITTYFDGKQVATNTNVVKGTYEIILQLEVATSSDSSWHTVPNANTPTSSMKVAEVQAYS